MPGGKALVRFIGVGKGVGRRDRDFRFRVLHGAAEAFELANTGDRVVGLDLDAGPLAGLGLDAVRVRDSASRSEGIDAALQRIATRKPEHGIDATRFEAARDVHEVGSPPVHGRVGAQVAYEGQAVLTPCGRDHPCAAQLRELDRERAHAAGRAVDDQRLAPLHVQCVVDALEGREPGGRDRAGVLQVEAHGYAPTFSATTATYSA